MARVILNFRASSGYVTDQTDATYCLGEAYPTTRSTTGTGLSVTFGFDTSLGANVRDRSTGVGPSLAGTGFTVFGATRTLRIDLPSSGVWELRAAFGDATSSTNVEYDILDSDGSTVLVSRVFSGTPIAVGEFYDASNVIRTNAADWDSNNAPINVTLAGSSVYFRLGVADSGCKVATIQLYQASSGPTVTSVTQTSGGTEGSPAVMTVALSGATSGSTNFAATLAGVTATGSGTDFTSDLASATYSNGVTFSGGNMVVPDAVSGWTVTIATTSDTLDEANETATLTVGGTAGTLTITDDDTAPTLTGTASSTVTAGSPVVITYNPGLSGQTRTYTLALTDGTATGGTDYDNTTVTGDFAVTAGTGSVSISGSTVTVDAGVTEFTLTITTTA